MNAPNFGALLDTDSQAVEKPKPLPAGTYVCVVKGQPRHDKSSKKGTEFVEFTLVPQSYLDDVDEDELKAWATKVDGSSKSLSDATIKATYYVTPDSLWRLKDFLDHCGIENVGSLRQRCDEAMNCQVLAVGRHEASEDGQSMFFRLARTAPVES